MIKERKENLENVIKHEYQKGIVKNAWLDFDKSFKYLRNPTPEQYKEYYEMFFLFNDYMNKREKV